jgi:hypothetical protein
LDGVTHPHCQEKYHFPCSHFPAIITPKWRMADRQSQNWFGEKQIKIMNDIKDITVCLTRESVCMGDDVEAPHSFTFQVSPRDSLNSLIQKVLSLKYFTDVEGWTWIAVAREQLDREDWSSFATYRKPLVVITPGSNDIEFLVPSDAPLTDYVTEKGKVEMHFHFKEKECALPRWFLRIIGPFIDFLIDHPPRFKG